MDVTRFTHPIDLHAVSITDPFWQRETELVRREVIAAVKGDGGVAGIEGNGFSRAVGGIGSPRGRQEEAGQEEDGDEAQQGGQPSAQCHYLILGGGMAGRKAGSLQSR